MQTDNTTAANRDAAPERPFPDGSPAYVLAERCAWHLLEKKLDDVVILDLRGRSDVCDFFVIASGAADTQVQAAARYAQDELVKAGHKARAVEGMREGRWVLIDFFDVVAHAFHVKTREYFQLDRLWGDAPRLELNMEWFAAPEVAQRHPDLTFTSVRPDAAGREI